MKQLAMCAALAAAMGLGLTAPASGESFTYHGQLQDGGRAANGRYDLQLTLYSAQRGGIALAGPVTLHGVDVRDGNFATTVDFGPMPPLTQQGWVEVQVKSGSGAFVALESRSPVAPEGNACPGSWTLDGNAGNPVGSFIGTADNSEVWVKANNKYVATFQPNGSVGLAYPYPTSGAYSTAIGYNAGTNYEGSIVTGGSNDATFGIGIRDTAKNQVILVAQNGVGINTAKGADGQPLRDELTIAQSANLPGSNTDLTLLNGTPGTTGYKGFNIAAVPNGYLYISGLYNNNPGALDYGQVLAISYYQGAVTGRFGFNGANADIYPINVGTNTSNGNGAHLTSAGVWTNASSRTFKDAFAAIDTVAVLEKLATLPIQTWFYKGNREDGQHMGPVAEEFAAAFGLGNNEKYIGTVDESGVALAAIQGLNKKVESENEKLKTENANLRASLDTLVARLEKLEARKGE